MRISLCMWRVAAGDPKKNTLFLGSFSGSWNPKWVTGTGTLGGGLP